MNKCGGSHFGYNSCCVHNAQHRNVRVCESVSYDIGISLDSISRMFWKYEENIFQFIWWIANFGRFYGENATLSELKRSNRTTFLKHVWASCKPSLSHCTPFSFYRTSMRTHLVFSLCCAVLCGGLSCTVNEAHNTNVCEYTHGNAVREAIA